MAGEEMVVREGETTTTGGRRTRARGRRLKAKMEEALIRL